MAESPPTEVCPAAGKHPETQHECFPPRTRRRKSPLGRLLPELFELPTLSNRSAASRLVAKEVDWTKSTVEFLKSQVRLHIALASAGAPPTDERDGEARQLFTVTSAGGGKWGKQTEKKNFSCSSSQAPFVSVRAPLIFFFFPSWFQRQLGILLWGGAPSFARRACVLLCVSTDGCHCMSAGLHIHVMEAEEPRRHTKWTAGLADWN